MDILYFFLPAILILGAATSYTDIFYGKIKNKHIGIALAFIPAAYSVIVGYYLLAGIPVNASYLADVGLNMAIALAFSFTAWHFKVWSAADGKLFFAYSGLVPLVIYSRTYFAYFPSFVMLINTFFPIFIYYAAKMVFSTSMKQKGEFFKKISPVMVLGLVLGVFWITWVSRLLNIFIGLDIGVLGNILIIMSIIFFMRRVAAVWKVSIVLSALRIIFDFQYVFTYQFLAEFVLFSVLLVLIFFVLMFSIKKVTSIVDVKKLKPGMLLADYVYLEKGKYKKMDEMEMFEMISKGAIKESDLLKIGVGGDGLSEEDIRKIEKLRKGRKLDFPNIRIAQTLPFAPFLFLGVLLTVIAGGNFLLLLVMLNVI